MAPRGKPGYFFGEPLKLLTEYLPLYLSTAPTKKQDFWTQFNPVWAEAFEQLDEDEKGELEDLEASYKDEKETVQRENEEAKQEARASQSENKELVFQPENEGQDAQSRAVPSVAVKITSLQGSPRRLHIGWVMWRDPKYGEVLRAQYRKKYQKEADEEEDEDATGWILSKRRAARTRAARIRTDASRGALLQRKLRLALAYFEELSGDKKTGLAEAREEDFEARRKAYESALKGEAECSVTELDERRRHVEAISHRALEALCAQMKCQGLLILGEISEGDEDELFLSMFSPKHPSIDFTKWAPVRSKAMLQTFADFLVARRRTSEPPPDAEGAAAPKQKAAPVKKKAPVRKSARLGKGKGKGRGKKKSTAEEEEEATESGAEERRRRRRNGERPALRRRKRTRETSWRAARTPRRCLRVTGAKMTRAKRIRELNDLGNYEFEREKIKVRNLELLESLGLKNATGRLMEEINAPSPPGDVALHEVMSPTAHTSATSNTSSPPDDAVPDANSADANSAAHAHNTSPPPNNVVHTTRS
ncbi:hypothetical protein DFH08DRAFT_798361 [Mycena albidolilacea]|uniref:Uncharacterized protein n=1 Tax=Mycena albidolilacea TaxID=1033008 RepID=A0AAD7AND7_9AGAR|nr:hypothetical protein DFH08DRAFT_798361 [Mycena albidolilacea]